MLLFFFFLRPVARFVVVLRLAVEAVLVLRLAVVALPEEAVLLAEVALRDCAPVPLPEPFAPAAPSCLAPSFPLTANAAKKLRITNLELRITNVASR